MSHIRNQVAIVGVGYSDLAPHAGKSLGTLAIDACRTAIADAGLSVDDIDGISNYPNASRIGGGEQDGVDIVSVKYIAQALALRQLSWSCSITSGTVVASLVHAVNAVASGAWGGTVDILAPRTARMIWSWRGTVKLASTPTEPSRIAPHAAAASAWVWRVFREIFREKWGVWR